MSSYGYKCEWCDGLVHEKLLAREVFRHARGYVILEDLAAGVCNKCGHKYYPAQVLKRVEEIALQRKKPDRTESVPVARA